MDFDRVGPGSRELWQRVFDGKSVLDIASHTGRTSEDILDFGARQVVGLEPRPDMVMHSRTLRTDPRMTFICGDATDTRIMPALLAEVDTVTCLGVLYHMHDHFNFFKSVCVSPARYLVIETLFGLESPNPTMLCNVESAQEQDRTCGINVGFDRVMVGAPNLAWIHSVLEIFGWHVTWFSTYISHLPDDRMLIVAENSRYSDGTPLPADLWQWHIEPGETVGTKRFSVY